LGTPPVTLPDVPALPARVVQVAAGEAHALFLALDPAPGVFAIGANDYGQLGLGDSLPRRDPQRAFEVPELQGAALVGGVACGGHVSMALSQRGEVWSWGRNEESGVLGNGAALVACVPSPTPLAQLRRKVRVVQVATSGWTALCVSHLGAVLSWGGGACGVHGHGHQADEVAAKAIRGLSDVTVIQAAMGPLHAVVLGSRGEVFTWGRISGAFGSEVQLQLTPKYVDALQSVRVVQVVAGGEHSLALSDQGEVYAWGAHASGALGGVPVLPDPAQKSALVHKVDLRIGRVREIGAGRCHSLFLAASAAESDQALSQQSQSSTLYICGQGVAPADHPVAAMNQAKRAAFNQPGLETKGGMKGALGVVPVTPPLGVPLKLTRVDVKRILEMMAAG